MRKSRLHPIARFWTQVRVQDDGCWIWMGPRRNCPKGVVYGSASHNGKSIGAHRLAWILLRGPIPDGLHIDHLCRVTRCVNPDHLEPVTQRENTLRGIGLAAVNARKTECIRGHAFTAENTIIHCGGKRACRTCVNAAQKRNRLKRQARLILCVCEPRDVDRIGMCRICKRKPADLLRVPA